MTKESYRSYGRMLRGKEGRGSFAPTERYTKEHQEEQTKRKKEIFDGDLRIPPSADMR